MEGEKNRELGSHFDTNGFGRPFPLRFITKHTFLSVVTPISRGGTQSRLSLSHNIFQSSGLTRNLFYDRIELILSLLVSSWTHCWLVSFPFSTENCYRNQLPLIKSDNWRYWVESGWDFERKTPRLHFSNVAALNNKGRIVVRRLITFQPSPDFDMKPSLPQIVSLSEPRRMGIIDRKREGKNHNATRKCCARFDRRKLRENWNIARTPRGD